MLDRFSGDNDDWPAKGGELDFEMRGGHSGGPSSGERTPREASAQVSARRAIEEYRERQRLKRMLDDIFTEGD